MPNPNGELLDIAVSATWKPTPKSQTVVTKMADLNFLKPVATEMPIVRTAMYQILKTLMALRSVKSERLEALFLRLLAKMYG